MTPESEAVERLESCEGPIKSEDIAHLSAFFLDLRRIEETANLESPLQLREGHWALLGLVSRAYQLSLCCIEMLAGKNWNGFYAGARGLAEAVAALAWALEKVERLPLLVREDPIVIGRIMGACYRRHPELKAMYRGMSFAVHPARSGHLLGFHPEHEQGVGIMTSFSMDFSEYFFETKVATLLVLIAWFAVDARELSGLNGGAALGQGRVMISKKEARPKA